MEVLWSSRYCTIILTMYTVIQSSVLRHTSCAPCRCTTSAAMSQTFGPMRPGCWTSGANVDQLCMRQTLYFASKSLTTFFVCTRERLAGPGCLHMLPFQAFLESDRAAYLIRPYIFADLYHRLSTRPFLSAIEKVSSIAASSARRMSCLAPTPPLTPFLDLDCSVG